jgi:hypothetical protein
VKQTSFYQRLTFACIRSIARRTSAATCCDDATNEKQQGGAPTRGGSANFTLYFAKYLKIKQGEVIEKRILLAIQQK